MGLTKYEEERRRQFEDLDLNRRMFGTYMLKCYNIRVKPIEDVLNKMENE